MTHRPHDYHLLLDQIWASTFAEYLLRDPRAAQSAYTYANKAVELFAREHERRHQLKADAYKETL